MKQTVYLLLRGFVFALFLCFFMFVFIRHVIPGAMRIFCPDYAAYAANLPDAAVGWDPVSAAVLAAACFLSGLPKHKTARVFLDSATVIAALCLTQINTIPVFRIVLLAIGILGG